MTPQARSGAPFELLRFEAAPLSGTLVVLEVEGRFRASTRFPRPPVLVLELGDDGRRIELTPVRTAADGQRWQASFAAPAEALAPGARLALGVRGTLLELPAPDEPDDGERFTALAREANRLRRRLAAAEDDAASVRAELGAAVAAARDGALSEAGEWVSALEDELAEARAAAEAARAEAEAQRDQALGEATARGESADRRAAELEAAVQAAEARATEAEERVADSEQELQAMREGIEVLRAELAEERERSQARIAELERELEAVRTGAGAVGGDAPDPTRPFTVAEQRDADADATQPLGPAVRPLAPREATLHDLIPPEGHDARRHGPNLSRWVAVGALVLFAFVLLGLLLGFLA